MHVLFIFFTRVISIFTGTRESPSVDLLLLIRLTALHSTTGAFLSLRSSDAEKKRRLLDRYFLLLQKPQVHP